MNISIILNNIQDPRRNHLSLRTDSSAGRVYCTIFRPAGQGNFRSLQKFVGFSRNNAER